MLARRVAAHGPLRRRARPATRLPRSSRRWSVGRTQVLGFVLAEVADDGLLPARFGKVQELCGPRELLPELVGEAVAWLREQGVEVVRAEAEEDDEEALELLSELGWDREAVRFATHLSE